jgi:TonB family protein
MTKTATSAENGLTISHIPAATRALVFLSMILLLATHTAFAADIAQQVQNDSGKLPQIMAGLVKIRPSAWPVTDEDVANTEALRACHAGYPQHSLDYGEEGMVRVRFDINLVGVVTKTTIEQSSGFSFLDQYSSKGLAHCGLHARLERGKPVASVFTVDIVYSATFQHAALARCVSSLDMAQLPVDLQNKWQQFKEEANRVLYPKNRKVGHNQDAGYIEFPTAETWCRNTLDLIKRDIGPDDPRIVPALTSLGDLYAENDMKGQAEKQYRLALAIVSKQSPIKENEVNDARYNLAMFYHETGRDAMALGVFRGRAEQ